MADETSLAQQSDYLTQLFGAEENQQDRHQQGGYQPKFGSDDKWKKYHSSAKMPMARETAFKANLAEEAARLSRTHGVKHDIKLKYTGQPSTEEYKRIILDLEAKVRAKQFPSEVASEQYSPEDPDIVEGRYLEEVSKDSPQYAMLKQLDNPEYTTQQRNEALAMILAEYPETGIATGYLDPEAAARGESKPLFRTAAQEFGSELMTVEEPSVLAAAAKETKDGKTVKPPVPTGDSEFDITDEDLKGLKREVDDLASSQPLGRHADFYGKAQNRIRESTKIQLGLHDDNKKLHEQMTKNIDKKAAHEAEILATEEAVAEMKATRAEAEYHAHEALKEDFLKKNRRANQLIMQKMEQVAQEREMGWQDYAAKSAIALGAIGAVIGQVYGSLMFAKHGGMPNVLLPLIMKAIDADIASMDSESKEIRESSSTMVNLYRELKSVYNDARLSRQHGRDAFYHWWDMQLEKVKKTRPISQKETFEELQAALKMKQNQEKITLEQDIINTAADGSQKLVEGMDRADKLTANKSSMLTSKIHNYQFLQNMSRDPEDKLQRPELEGEDRDDYNFGVRALAMIPSLKADMVELMDEYGITDWKQAAELKFSDLFGRFQGSPKFVKLQGLVGRLKQFGQIYAKFYENGRISEGDRAFWQETMAADLNEVNIINAFSRLIGSEYFSRKNVLLSAAKMSPLQLAQETPTLMSALTSNNVLQLMKDHGASIVESNKILAEGGRYTPHNVGMAAVEEAYAFKSPLGMKMQEAIHGQYMSNIQAPADTVPVQRNLAEAIDRGSDAKNPLAGFVRVPTTKGDFALMEPAMAKSFLKMQDFAKKSASLKIEPSGGKGGARTLEMIQEMETARDPDTGKLMYEADPTGGHTQHGGYNAVDITVKDSKDSREYKWMILHGPKFGFFPGHKVKKSGTHWHHFVYEPSRMKGKS